MKRLAFLIEVAVAALMVAIGIISMARSALDLLILALG